MKNTAPRPQGALLIIAAGIFWGSMGLFVRPLSAMGFTAAQTVCLRLTGAALIFLILRLATAPRALIIRPRHIPLFALTGLGSILFFTVCYFSAINMMSMATAAILLYTSPIWVMLMSALFFKERITANKLLAIALAFSGCALISGVGGGRLSLPGLMVGLGAGLGYALYSIFGTVALRHYEPLTVTAWSFMFAAAGSWFVCAPAQMADTVAASPPWLLAFCLCMSLVTAVIPFTAYTLGLKTTPAGKAAVLATVEPLSAAVLGLVFFKERLSPASLCGIALILAAIVILSLKNKENNKKQDEA